MLLFGVFFVAMRPCRSSHSDKLIFHSSYRKIRRVLEGANTENCPRSIAKTPQLDPPSAHFFSPLENWACKSCPFGLPRGTAIYSASHVFRRREASYSLEFKVFPGVKTGLFGPIGPFLHRGKPRILACRGPPGAESHEKRNKQRCPGVDNFCPPLKMGLQRVNHRGPLLLFACLKS